jgi:hypothetical protein
VCDLGRTLNPERSHCTRRIENGRLIELVDLHGDRDQLSDEELERFVGSFPIMHHAQGSDASTAGDGREGIVARSEKPAAAGAGRARREAFDATG